MAQFGQQIVLETVAWQIVERGRIQGEEAGIDQMVGQRRLLAELADPVVVGDREGSILRRQRDNRDGGGAAVTPMTGQQGSEIDVAQAVAVRQEELLAHPVEARQHTVTGARVLAGVDDVDSPIRRELPDVPLNCLAAIADSEDEILHALAGIDVHHVMQNRPITDRQHRLRKVGSGRQGADTSTAAQDQCLHVARIGARVGS